jgi:4-hydroxybenzoate polyprenyltransferase
MILAYSLFLKHVVILDVIVLALGFVMRAIAGAVVIRVSISSWLLVCAVFLALFLALNKRRHELVLLGEDAKTHRKILSEYSSHLLDLMIVIVAACTVMAYALYTTAFETVEKFGTRNLIFTLPFVLYGIFRYLYLVHQKNLGGSPELILLKDRSMQLNLLLYILVVGFILYSR